MIVLRGWRGVEGFEDGCEGRGFKGAAAKRERSRVGAAAAGRRGGQADAGWADARARSRTGDERQAGGPRPAGHQAAVARVAEEQRLVAQRQLRGDRAGRLAQAGGGGGGDGRDVTVRHQVRDGVNPRQHERRGAQVGVRRHGGVEVDQRAREPPLFQIHVRRARDRDVQLRARGGRWRAVLLFAHWGGGSGGGVGGGGGWSGRGFWEGCLGALQAPLGDGRTSTMCRFSRPPETRATTKEG